jgi:hypothetical protein
VRFICELDEAVATKFDGAAGVAMGVGVGVTVAVGVGVGLAVGVGVGVGVGALIWTIFATEGTAFEFRINSM